jgi:hypothetical protein
MATEKRIDSPLMTSYTIAVLTQDHADRLFAAIDPYRDRLMWSRKYRSGVAYESAQKASEVKQAIIAGEHPAMINEKAGIDLSSIRVLRTDIHFETQT